MQGTIDRMLAPLLEDDALAPDECRPLTWTIPTPDDDVFNAVRGATANELETCRDRLLSLLVMVEAERQRRESRDNEALEPTERYPFLGDNE